MARKNIFSTCAGKKILIGALMLMMIGTSYAQQGSATAKASDDNESNSSGGAVNGPVEAHELRQPAGKGVIYPIATLAYGYRDNVYEEDDGSIEGASLLRWGLGGGYQANNRDHLYGLEYLVEGNKFLDGENDEDEISQRATAYWGTAFTPRHHLDLGVEYKDAYDPRGEEDSIRNIRQNLRGSEPDTWTETAGGGIYSFGSNTARGRLELSGFVTDREYDNNQQEYRSRDIVDIGAAFYFRVAAKTQGFVQYVNSDIDYVDQSPTDPSQGRDLDSEEDRYMVGLRWDPNQRWSGVFRIGQVEKTFTTISGREDYDETSWDSSLLWRPNGRNSFSINYFRAPREIFVYDRARALDDFVEVEDVRFSWSHLWGKKIKSALSLYQGDDKYFPSGRIDDRKGYSVGLSYALPRWGTIGITYQRRELKSNFPEHDYEDNIFMLFFNLGAALGLGEGNTRAPGIRNQRAFQPGYAVY